MCYLHDFFKSLGIGFGPDVGVVGVGVGVLGLGVVGVGMGVGVLGLGVLGLDVLGIGVLGLGVFVVGCVKFLCSNKPIRMTNISNKIVMTILYNFKVFDVACKVLSIIMTLDLGSI